MRNTAIRGTSVKGSSRRCPPRWRKRVHEEIQNPDHSPKMIFSVGVIMGFALATLVFVFFTGCATTSETSDQPSHLNNDLGALGIGRP